MVSMMRPFFLGKEGSKEGREGVDGVSVGVREGLEERFEARVVEAWGKIR